MQVSYGKLWQKCVEEGIKPSFFYKDKSKPYYISPSTIYEMHKNTPVSLKVIDTFCSYFKCQPSDIMEFV